MNEILGSAAFNKAIPVFSKEGKASILAAPEVTTDDCVKSSIAISCCTNPIAVVSNGAVKATLRTFQPPEPLETTTVPAGRILSVLIS